METVQAQFDKIQRRATRNGIMIPAGVIGTLVAGLLAFGAMRDRIATHETRITTVETKYDVFSQNVIDRLGRIETLLKGSK